MELFILTIGFAVSQVCANIIAWKIVFRRADGADKKVEVAPSR